MLKKLLKYEFKSTGRIFLPIYVLLLAFALLSHFSIGGLVDGRSELLSIISGITLFGYVLVIFSTLIITAVVIVQRFYKNLTGDEGYLMHTLPVTTHQLIVSKLIVSIVWSFVSLVMVLLSVVILMLRPEVIAELPSIFGILGRTIDMIIAEIGAAGLWLNIIAFIIASVVGAITSTLLIFASVAIGHTFKTHRILGSFGAYIGLTMAVQLVVGIAATIGIGFASGPIIGLMESAVQFSDVSGILSFAMWTGVFLQIVFGIAWYFITQYVLSHQLNLE